MPAVGDTFHVREGQSVTIRELSPERLVVEASWGPAEGRPPRHHHPSQDERFAVLEGELVFDVAGRGEVTVRAGEEIAIPKGTIHRVWNAAPGSARATWEVMPAQRTAEMFAALDGGINAARGARILWEFRREFRLATSLKS